MHIIDLRPDNARAVQQAAQMLHEEFNQARWGFSWDTLDEARNEVHMLMEEGHICRAAVDENSDVLGWIGGLPEYDGNVWELHPLVVRADLRSQGVGKALVNDLEEQVRARGGLTIMLGSDDHSNMTSLGGVNLYPNVWEHIAHIRNLQGHPYEFYQKLGYVITGVMPDANGIGKPDIYMAKSLIAQ